jgi:hypothetical protein
LIYPESTTTLGIEGKYYWQHDGHKESEGPPFLEDFVLGHQLHAQILFFDKIHQEYKENLIDNFNGKECLSLESSKNGNKIKAYFTLEGELLGMEILPPGSNPIVMSYHDWRNHEGFVLPFKIGIDDGDRVFIYSFNSLAFNLRTLDDFRLKEELQTDEQKLLRMHRKGMDDHLAETINELQSIRNDSVIIVSRGEIYTMDSTAFDGGMLRIMNSRDHYSYNDLIRPIVKISDDGSLAWVIVQVSANGIVFNGDDKENLPLDFTSAWIELYEKKKGKWYMVGNVSNFKE